jgi:hypothetical protein
MTFTSVQDDGGMSDDLIEFLRAMLDEDERAARAATSGSWRHDPDKHWHKPGTAWFEEAVFAGSAGDAAICVAGTGETDDPQSMADAAHIARHDPAQVLAEVAAKREIMELGICCACAVEKQPCDHRDATLRLLTLPYAWHPDYREEWRS